MTLEATEVVVLSDERHKRIIVVEELLNEIASMKKRLLGLEERYDANVKASRFATRARKLEARRGQLDRVGRHEDADTDGVLAEVVDAEDLITVRSSRSEVELSYAATVAGDDDTVSVHAE
jgi:hypothetical protein